MSRLASRISFVSLLAAAALLTGCERPPTTTVQTGYRGTGMLQVYNPRTMATQIPLNQPPAPVPGGSSDGPKAKDILKNVQVLGHLSIGEFTAQMAAITAWVAPKEGCGYCHNLADLADDGKYTKVVARRMIQMTQHVNADWKPHVAATGVTCYTCHRGNPVPQYTWTSPVPQDKRGDMLGNRNGQNAPAPTVGLMALPNDPFTPYLLNAATIRVAGQTALPTGNKNSIQATEATYGLMVHISNSLGVNCTYCHNSRSFGNWAESSPKRTVAWQGLHMVNDLNTAFVAPLAKTLPPERLGPNGDGPKLHCATCHQGAYKPVYGAQMAKDWPGLLSAAPAKAEAAPAPAAPAPKPAAKGGKKTVAGLTGTEPAARPLSLALN